MRVLVETSFFTVDVSNGDCFNFVDPATGFEQPVYDSDTDEFLWVLKSSDRNGVSFNDSVDYVHDVVCSGDDFLVFLSELGILNFVNRAHIVSVSGPFTTFVEVEE